MFAGGKYRVDTMTQTGLVASVEPRTDRDFIQYRTDMRLYAHFVTETACKVRTHNFESRGPS